MRLENWAIVYVDNGFTAPELVRQKLIGDVYDSNRPDGSPITTSTIQELDPELKWARTRNSYYHLGKPSDEYQNFLNGLKGDKSD